MLGGMKQQADDRRRQTTAPDFPRVEQARLGRRSELIECASDSFCEGRGEADAVFHSGTGIRLRDESGTLDRRQLFASGIGQETIEAAGGVANVKSD